MHERATHRVFDAEVLAVTGTPGDWRYTLRSITPGVAWQQENLKPRVRVGSNVDLVSAPPGDLVRVYDRPGDLRIYPYEGIPFDPCGENEQVQGDDGGENGVGIGGLAKKLLRKLFPKEQA